MHKKFKRRQLFSQNTSSTVKKPKAGFVVLPFIWGGLKRVAMGLGFLLMVQFALLLFVLPALLSGDDGPDMPDEMVLYLTLDDVLAETPDGGSLMDPFAETSLTLREVNEVLAVAAGDDRVKGIVLRLNSGGGAGVSQVQEFHAALAEYKQSGKFATIYSSSYGEGAGGLSRYYLASAFDEIWMQPLGIVSISGISAEMPYLRGVLDKVGVEPEFFQRKDYKTAYESMTRKTISPENKDMMERLIGDLRGEIVAGASVNRGMEPKAFEGLVARGLLTADEALEVGLITHMDYADVLVDGLKEEYLGDAASEDDLFVSFESYATDVGVLDAGAFFPVDDDGFKGDEDGRRVALIYASGAIMPSADGGGLGGGNVAAADEIAPAIMDAARDESIDVIVLRVDSPGGSPSASESILRALEKAQENGKTVIVSMGSVAASGGYWIAAYADQIFALPTTITGSIGVVGGKFSLAELWGKIGVNWETIRWGENAGMWSMNESFSTSEAERFNVMLDSVYDAFIARVSKGRDMDPSAVDAIAGGRVWTGKRAIEIGLVDQLGGLDAALDYAAEIVGADSRAALDIVVMPRPKSGFEALMSLLDGQVKMGQAVRSNAALLQMFEPLSGVAARVQNPQDFMVYQDLSVH